MLQTAANCSSVPLWPVSPSAGWASGVDKATGIPNGQGPLVENDAAATIPTLRPNQGALDVPAPRRVLTALSCSDCDSYVASRVALLFEVLTAL